ncbi:MAG TPA: hypothetical protein VFQ65_16495 [Kofleriaceae bacterium]|nr:hypothetical protein [Kofleriaceae bacterium]
MRALAVLVLLVACSKHEDAAPKKSPVPPLPAAEVQRGQDACTAYIAKVCACTSPAAQKECPLAKALPEAMKLALDTAANPETERADALRAQTNVLETAKQCIEQVAKLPAIGCP